MERKSFALEGKKLSVKSGNSRVEVMAADVKDVEVSRQVDGWVVFGSGPHAVWKMEQGVLTLDVDCDGVASDCQASHVVKVPRGVAVDVEDGNGDVLAHGFDTDLGLRSENGRVTVRDVTGALRLDSGNGQVVVEKSSPSSVVANADNGQVRLRFDAPPRSVDVVSDNGEVLVELPGKGPYAVDARSENGDVRVDVPTDPASAHVVKARSDNGTVAVRGVN
ncbi:DUF4097 family beta strand repeat-containing protein [Streptomyces sp. NPDC001941]|uniref:DUF4097 family beta strand repeat-containing protein n=1 Tax=Streptomyces sp. NPDC001941 TaxID=3154659 RepID=UPI003327F865